LFDLVVFPQFSPIKSSHAADLLPLGQAEGGCHARKSRVKCIPSNKPTFGQHMQVLWLDPICLAQYI